MADNGKLTIEIDGDTKSLESSIDSVDKVVKNKKTWDDYAKESNKSFDEIRADVKKLAQEFQDSGDNIPVSYKKAYAKLGIYSKENAQDLKDDFVDIENKAEKSSLNMSSAFQTGFNAIGNAARVGVQAIGAVVGLVSTALVAGAAAAYNYGTEFETSLAKVGSIADTTAVPIEELGQSVLDLSGDLGQAATELNEATYQAISAGVGTADAVSFVGDAGRLAVAGFTDTTTAVDVLTSAINAYGLAAGDAARVSDVLLTTQNLGKTTVDELSAVLGQTIPTAAAFGVNIEQLGASFATLTANGIQTAEAGTYLNSMLTELGRSGTTASDALEEVTGKNFTELIADGNSLGDVLAILETEADAAGLSMLDMFGSAEAGKAALSLISEGADEFNNTLAAMNNSAGATAAAFEVIDNTTSRSVEKIANNFKNLGISIYNSSEGPIAETVALFSDMSAKLGEAFDTGGLQGLAVELGNSVLTIAEYAADNLPALINTANTVITSFLDALTSDPSAVSDGALAIIDALVNTFGNIASYAPALIAAATDIIATLVTALGSNPQAFVSGAGDILAALGNSIITLLPLLLSTALDLIIALGEYLALNAPMLILGAFTLMTTLAQLIIDNLPTIILVALEIIIAIIETLIQNMPMFMSAAVTLMQGLIMGLWQALPLILDALGYILYSLLHLLATFVLNWLQVGKDFITSMQDGISEKWEELTAWFDETINSLISWALEKVSEFVSIGENIVGGIWEGIQNAWGALVSWFEGLIGGLVSIAAGVLDIHSPSRVFEKQIGYQIPAGEAVGIKKGAPLVTKALMEMTDVDGYRKRIQTAFAKLSIPDIIPSATRRKTSDTGNTPVTNNNNNDNRIIQQFNVQQLTPGFAHTQKVLASIRRTPVNA